MSGRSTARRDGRGSSATIDHGGDAGDPAAAKLGSKVAAKSGARSKTARRVPTSEEWLAQYRRRPTNRLRDALLERHRPEVESIARALAARLPRSVEVEDLVHAGMWGLMQAIEKFRAELGSPFRPFMRPRVRGAMLDELRNLDFLPRLWRRRARALDSATSELRAVLGREPNDHELAQRLGTSEAWLARARTRVHEGPIDFGGRFDSGLEGDPLDAVPDEHLTSPIEQLDRQDLLAMIEASLQPVEWKVLQMHYFQGLSGKEVAQALRLSPARICQIHGTVLSRLKQRFAALAI
jgi:RNA polymerase sigma factor for flagellar operon FliA